MRLVNLGIRAWQRPSGGGGGAVSLSAAILARNPWFYYKLDETTLTTAVDASPNARNGTYVGSGMTATTGLFGGSSGAIAMTGAGRVSAPTQTGLANRPFSTLISFSTTAGGVQQLLSAEGNTGERFMQFRLNSGTLEFIIIFPGTTSIAGTTGLNNGQARMAGAAFDPTLAAADGRMKLYLDGVEVARSTTALTNDQTVAKLAVGAANNEGIFAPPFTGTLDSAAYFDTALSAADIAAIWAARDTP